MTITALILGMSAAVTALLWIARDDQRRYVEEHAPGYYPVSAPRVYYPR